MRRFFVQINEDAFGALVDLASEERRDVRDQAALILERTLRATRQPRATVMEVRSLPAMPQDRVDVQAVPA
jgi:hypothetical protein